jgi:hypothetical protein
MGQRRAQTLLPEIFGEKDGGHLHETSSQLAIHTCQKGEFSARHAGQHWGAAITDPIVPCSPPPTQHKSTLNGQKKKKKDLNYVPLHSI